MSTEEFLKEKLQTAADGAETARDIVTMIEQSLPEDVKQTIVKDSGDTVEIGDALEIMFDLLKNEHILLNNISQGILSDNGGMFTLQRIDEAEQIIQDNISDADSLYPFDPEEIEARVAAEEAANE